MNKQRNKHIAYVIIICCLIAIAVLSAYYRNVRLNKPDAASIVIPNIDIPEIRRSEYHAHADFKVFISGREVDFSKDEYDAVNPKIHLHVGNYMGDKILHIESRDATLGDFFSSVGMKLSSACFSINRVNYCNSGNKTLKIYVNSVQNLEYENYRPKDLDRVLVTYGGESERAIESQIDSVTNVSCVFSEKCEIPQEAINKILYS